MQILYRLKKAGRADGVGAEGVWRLARAAPGTTGKPGGRPKKKTSNLTLAIAPEPTTDTIRRGDGSLKRRLLAALAEGPKSERELFEVAGYGNPASAGAAARKVGAKRREDGLYHLETKAASVAAQ